tara:strand:- start:93219 stop:93617 length:399 start_codon:yes stop_codon:yes gene_type:complete
MSVIIVLGTTPVAKAQNLIQIDPITLTKQDDIKDIETLGAATDNMVKTIMACTETGKDSIECQCEHLSEAKHYQNTLSGILDKHPEWIGKATFYEYEYKGDNPNYPPVMGKTTSFIGHSRQSEMIDNLSCNK